MTPEQRYRYHRKTGKLPEERAPKIKHSHAVVVHLGVTITQPLSWALAQYKKKEFEKQGLQGLRLRGVTP